MPFLKVTLLMFLLKISLTIASCDDYIKINNKYYKQERRYNITGVPSDMSIQHSNGEIFYILIGRDAKMKLQRIKNDQIEDVPVDGVAQSTTIDNANQKVYIATSKGVFIFHDDKQEAVITGEDVMYIAVASDNEVIYIATYPQNRVQKYHKGRMERFVAIPNGRGLTIDRKNNLFFVAHQTPYVLRSDGHSYSNISSKIKGLPENKAFKYVFAVNKNNEVFLNDHGGRFYVVNDDDAAIFLGRFNVKEVNAFAFDADDNIYIGGVEVIIKFKAYDSCP